MQEGLSRVERLDRRCYWVPGLGTSTGRLWGFELERLRREAVLMGLSYLGFVRLIRVSDYAIGEECLIKDISR